MPSSWEFGGPSLSTSSDSWRDLLQFHSEQFLSYFENRIKDTKSLPSDLTNFFVDTTVQQYLSTLIYYTTTISEHPYLLQYSNVWAPLFTTVQQCLSTLIYYSTAMSEHSSLLQYSNVWAPFFTTVQQCLSTLLYYSRVKSEYPSLLQ